MKKVKKVEFKYDLGSVVKDKITGFEGVIIYRTQWLNNCNVYGIKPTKLKDGIPIDAHQFDEPQIKLIEVEKIKESRKTGGPCGKMKPANRQ